MAPEPVFRYVATLSCVNILLPLAQYFLQRRRLDFPYQPLIWAWGVGMSLNGILMVLAIGGDYKLETPGSICLSTALAFGALFEVGT